MNIFLLAASILAMYTTVMFAIAIIKRDNSIADIAYGLGFMLVAVCLYTNQDITPSIRSGLVTLFISLWALRLAYRIGRKNWGKPEDFRYAAWRVEWSKKGQVYLLLRSFLQVFVLQGLIIFIVVLPGILANTPQTDTLKWYNLVGAGIWVFGFIFESVGDAQLDRFLKLKKAGKVKTNIMKTGLWKYTRHPNYFGESMQWWGLALICLMGVENSLLAFVSPALITYLLLFVSGIPLLEKRWEGDPEWEEYKKRTNAFLPGIPEK
jgi:steroid 5-alpha reductase family enzyme